MKILSFSDIPQELYNKYTKDHVFRTPYKEEERMIGGRMRTTNKLAFFHALQSCKGIRADIFYYGDRLSDAEFTVWREKGGAGDKELAELLKAYGWRIALYTPSYTSDTLELIMLEPDNSAQSI